MMMWIEVIAAIFGVLCVGLMALRIIWCWPAGIVQVALYTYVFYEAQLYSDMILHIIYIGLNALGWYHWYYGGARVDALPVTTVGKHLWAWLVLVAAGTAVWGYTMASQTDAALPYPDAFTTVCSLVAQWLTIRKKLEGWLLWMVVNVAGIAIYFYKDLYFTTGLYGLFLVIAILGYRDWRRAYYRVRVEGEH